MDNKVVVIHKRPIPSGMIMENRTVYDETGNIVFSHPFHVAQYSEARTFSEAEHGKEYKKIAAEYAKSNARNVASVEGLDDKDEQEVKVAVKKGKKVASSDQG